MDDKPVVDIRNLIKIYNGRFEPAVNNISLEIHAGEIFGLIGPNGAGKTTTLKILCGQLKPTSGDIRINESDLSKDLNIIKKYIGVVSQEIALYDKLTAYENLYYFGRLFSMHKKELNLAIDTLLNRMGLNRYKNEMIENFSGGMKRRINLLAGLLHNPKLLFLDEPTIGCDVQSRNVIREYLLELNASGTTMIYTSHLMDDVEKLCTRISIIDYGKIILTGTPSGLIFQYPECSSLEDLFLKSTGRHLRNQ
jgi:ABC-2 type transport system ATP-binding protein